MSPYASLDVGSNTVRLLLAERIGIRNFRPLRVARIITRLGGHFSPAGDLDEAAMSRTLRALKDFVDLLNRERTEAVFAIGTGVLREARNGMNFIEQVRLETGLALRLVSGEEEARLMLQGVLWSLPDPSPTCLVADIGGWSTEVFWTENGLPKKIRSVALGTVALSERFLKCDPPAPEELRALEEHIRKVVKDVREEFEREGLSLAEGDRNLIGTAGTITTLSAIDQALPVYDPQKITGHRITGSALKKIYTHLRSLPALERSKIPGLEKGREDLIVPGAAVVLNLMEIFGLPALISVDSGLLEGILLEGLARIP